MGSLNDVRALVAATVERFGAIDVVVNNAANALAEPIGSFTEAGVTKSIEVNVKGPLFLIQESLPYLRVSDHASVINMVSAGAWLFSATVAHYAAAKAAMVSYTKALAAGLAPEGIRVNALAPGSVDTDMTRRHRTSSHRRYGPCLPAATGGERQRDGRAGTLPRLRCVELRDGHRGPRRRRSRHPLSGASTGHGRSRQVGPRMATAPVAHPVRCDRRRRYRRSLLRSWLPAAAGDRAHRPTPKPPASPCARGQLRPAWP